MKKTLLFLTFFTLTSIVFSQDITGIWKTIDDETNKEKSYVEIFKRGDFYFGKVVKIADPNKQNAKCIDCEDSHKDKPVMGLEMVWDLEFDKDDNEYDDGYILDPNNGKVYDCKIWLDDDNTLMVRGYVGFFFRTQTWHRVK